MDNVLFNKSRILRNLQACSAAAGLALMSLSTPVSAADAKPTAAEISKARAECAEQKRKVRALESANADDAQVAAARLVWAHACGQAQDLISAASGIPPPAPGPDPNASK